MNRNRSTFGRVACQIAFSLTLVGFLALSKAAHSQGDDRVFDRHVKSANLVFTSSDVYVIGQPTRLCDGSTSFFADPRGRYALISRRSTPPQSGFLVPPDKTETPPPNASLILYDSQTGRTTTLWQRTVQPKQFVGVSHVEWLMGVDVALVSVGIESPDAAPLDLPHPPDSDYSLLEIRLSASATNASAPTRTLLRSVFPISAYPSPKTSVALLREDRVEEDAVGGQRTVVSRYRTLNTSGVVGAPLQLGPRASGGFQWNETGEVAYLVDTIPAADSAPAGSALPAPVPPVAKPTRQWYALTVETGRLLPIASRPKPVLPVEGVKAGSDSRTPVRLVDEVIVIAPPALKVGQVVPQPAPTVSRAAEKLWPLWLQRRDAPLPSEHYPTAALIAADVGEATLLPDASAILYSSDEALYSVPLTHHPRADVEGAYRKYLQQKTLSNAKEIALAIMMYSQDYDETYPSVANVLKALGPYMQDDSLVNNPETGQLGFVYLMNGESIASIDNPATKVMGYLFGPGGRAAIFADGHSRWQPDVGTAGVGN